MFAMQIAASATPRLLTLLPLPLSTFHK